MGNLFNFVILGVAILIGWRFIQCTGVRSAREAARREREREHERSLEAMTQSVLANRSTRQVGFAPGAAGAGIVATGLVADADQVVHGPLQIHDALATGIMNPNDPFSALAAHNALTRDLPLGAYSSLDGTGHDGLHSHMLDSTGSYGSFEGAESSFGDSLFSGTDSSFGGDSGFGSGTDSWS